MRSYLRQKLFGVKYMYKARRLPDVDYNPDARIENFLFICGLHRSGTTLLERMMTTRYNLSYLRMTVPESEGQFAQNVYSPAIVYGGPGKFAFDQRQYDELAGLTDYAAYRTRIEAGWKRFMVGGSTTLLEKSPPNVVKIGWLRQVFPGAKFVVLTRDPRAVSLATQKWALTSHTELMEHWHTAYSHAHRDMRPEDCIAIRYEELCADVEGTLQRVQDHCGLKPSPNPDAVEQRFADIRNTNAKYIEAFEGEIRSDGIWREFGYAL